MFLLLVVFLCIGVYNIYLTQISFNNSIFTTLGIGVMVLLIIMLVYRFPRRIISILDNYVYVKLCIQGRSRTQDFTVNLLYLSHFKLSNIKFIQLYYALWSTFTYLYYIWFSNAYTTTSACCVWDNMVEAHKSALEIHV